MTSTSAATPIALYIHIPFCSKLCPYCHFYKTTWDSESETTFIQALLKELDFYGNQNVQIHTIFFGGGTPNLLRRQSIESILEKIHSIWSLSKDIEISMEMNPGISSVEKLRHIRQLGVNRVSLGIQSFHDHELRFLGRNHNAASCHKSIDAVRDAGFENLNLDFIFGLPQSHCKDLEETIQTALSYQPEHLAPYCLSIEPNTSFKRRGIQNLDSDLEAAQYELIQSMTEKVGYHHYEISNFAKTGYECQHNMSYWEARPYIGCGPGAHSFFKGGHYKQPRQLRQYSQNPIPRAFQQKYFPKPSKQTQIENYIFCQLRLCRPFNIQKMNHQFKIDFFEQFKAPLETLTELKLITIAPHQICVTPKGKLLLNSIMELLLGNR